MNRIADPMNRFLKTCGRKVFDLQGNFAFIAFRILILLLVLFFLIYGHDDALKFWEMEPRVLHALILLAALQFLSNAAVWFAGKKPVKKWLPAGLFLFDILFISLALYWTQGFESDLFIIYFLVVFMTVIARKSSISFLVAGLACLLYGFLFLKSRPAADLFQPQFLIRFPLLLVVAFFSSIISQDINTEHEILTAQMQAYWMRSEKLAALGEMASGIAHEINNPLTSILGTVQLALTQSRKEPGNVAMAEEDLRVIERNTVRCKKIIADILKFAGQQEFRFERIDVEQPLNDAVSLLENEMHLSQIHLIWKKDPQKFHGVFASASHLSQVFFNLLVNSVHAMPQGGTITLNVKRKTLLNDRNIRMEAVEITVEDTGAGIPQEHLELLFQPFFSGRISEGGTGLGLAVAYGIITKHNGKIFAESEGKGKGARMTIQLPAAPENSPEADAEIGGKRNKIWEPEPSQNQI